MQKPRDDQAHDLVPTPTLQSYTAQSLISNVVINMICCAWQAR